jgi:pyruvate dehydrogenase kinase 2/3/4
LSLKRYNWPPYPTNIRYFPVPDIPSHSFPPELHEYNAQFTRTLENIKRRHDPTVTTVAQGVLEWKNAHGKTFWGKHNVGSTKSTAQGTPREIQEWLDRFYMSRIGIRFLIGQRKYAG